MLTEHGTHTRARMFRAPAPSTVPANAAGKPLKPDTKTAKDAKDARSKLLDGSTVMPQTPARYIRITDPQREFCGFSVNVVLTTILFIVIFIAASSWTMAVSKEFEHKKGTYRYWLFSLFMTIVTVGLSIGFGELAHSVNKKVEITITNLLGTSIE